MPFALTPQKRFEDELTTLARRELRKTVRTLNSVDASFDDVVRDARRRLKKVRAVAQLLKQAGGKPPRRDRKRLKTAALALSRPRDSAAVLATFDEVGRRFPGRVSEHTWGVIRRALTAARSRHETRAGHDKLAAKVARRVKKVRKSAQRWTRSDLRISTLIAVVAESYRRSQAAMEHARATNRSAAVHEWRKELKTLWYQLRLVAPLVGGAAAMLADLKQIQTDLGADHDLVVLAATLRSCPALRPLRDDVRAVERLARARRDALRQQAFVLGAAVHARKPSTFADWLRISATVRKLRAAAA